MSTTGSSPKTGSLKEFVDERLAALGKTSAALAEILGIDKAKIADIYTKPGTIPGLTQKLSEFLDTTAEKVTAMMDDLTATPQPAPSTNILPLIKTIATMGLERLTLEEFTYLQSCMDFDAPCGAAPLYALLMHKRGV